MAFFQDAPRLGNTFEADALLREHLARTLPPEALPAIEAELHELGALAGGAPLDPQSEERHLEPRLVAWDPWGRRVLAGEG